MKKYISIPDIQDESITHYFEVPSAFFVHAKACTDGVAIVIGNGESDVLYGFTVPASDDLLPVLEYLVVHQDTAGIEYLVSFLLNVQIHEFLDDETAHVFNVISCRGMLQDELDYNLEGAMLPEMFEGRKHKLKRRKRNKNHPEKRNN